MSAKRPHIAKVINAANKHGLYVLAEGTGMRFSYKFWDRKTGKCVLTYYPDTKRWLGQHGEGNADDYRAALDAALGVR